MTLSIDGTPQTSTTNLGNSCAVTLSTSNTNDIICIFAFANPDAGSAATVSGVADTASLSWSKRKAVAFPHAGGTNATLELWYAVSSGTLSSDTITVTYTNATSSGVRVLGFAVSGANTATPFDANASLPGSGTSSGSTSQSNASPITTNNANTMLIACVRGDASLGTVTRPTSFTQILGTGANEDASQLVVSSIQSSQTYTYSWTGGSIANGMIVDAIQQAAAGGSTVNMAAIMKHYRQLRIA